MAAAFGLTCCSSTLVPEGKPSHRLQEHPGLVPKLSHREWQKHRYRSKTVQAVSAGCFYGFCYSRNLNKKDIGVL